MNRRSLVTLVLALLVGFVPAHGAFLNNTLGGTTVLVDFDQFTTVTQLDSNPVQTYNDGGLTINMNVPNFISNTDTIIYGFGGPTDFYLVNQTLAPNSQSVEFTLSGGTVSSIGIRLSAFPAMAHNPIVLEIFDASNAVIESYTFPAWNGTSGNSSLGASGGFYGFDLGSGNATITRFRISGGVIALNDLRFGGLETSGGGGIDPDPDVDPEAVPEASTFLLCGSALGLLSLAGRFRKQMRRTRG